MDDSRLETACARTETNLLSPILHSDHTVNDFNDLTDSSTWSKSLCQRITEMRDHLKDGSVAIESFHDDEVAESYLDPLVVSDGAVLDLGLVLTVFTGPSISKESLVLILVFKNVKLRERVNKFKFFAYPDHLFHCFNLYEVTFENQLSEGRAWWRTWRPWRMR